MASRAELPLAGSTSNVQPQEIGFDQSLDTYQSATTRETTPREPSPSRTVLKSPPKNGIPPKRLSTTAKRTTPSANSASSKSHPSPTSRGAPGTGLSKPPTRPSISSAVRRPATGVTAATAASTGHKKKLSTASNETYSARRGDISGSEENTKPRSKNSEARRNVYDNAELKNAVQGIHAERPNLATKAEQSAASRRVNNASPLKSALRTTTNSSRPTSTHATLKSSRPISSSAGGATKVEATKKRLSTIPASPAQAKPETRTSEPSITLEAVRAARPVLHARKSTMSVTIEQRLREMELVHQMLHVAMAEDGAEEDDVKEEYGRKVDESLATLRTRLEEARRNEGTVAQESGVSGASVASSEQSSGFDTNQAKKSHSELLELLRESEDKVSTLVSAQGHCKEEIQRLREAQAREMDQVSKSHQIELAAARTETVEAEARYQKEIARATHDRAEAISRAVSERSTQAMNKLKSEVNTYALKIQGLELDLAAEIEKNAISASAFEDFQLEITKLQNLLFEQRRALADAEIKLDQHIDILKDKDNVVSEKDRHILDLQSELQELHTNQAWQLEEVERVSQHRCKSFESELSAVRDKVSELELSHESLIYSHEREASDKDKEIKGLAQVIEEFQAQMQELHEQNERAIDETKLDLIEEHEKVVHEMHKKNCNDAADLKLSNQQKLQALRTEHENALESARADYAEDLKKLDELLEVSEGRKELAELAIAEGKMTIEALEAQVASLKLENDERMAGKSLLGDTSKHASDGTAALQKPIETLRDDTEDKDKQYAAAIRKIEGDLAGATKALEERKGEMDLTVRRHAEEMNSLATLHAAELEAVTSESRDALRQLQKNHDDLLAKSNQTANEDGEVLETLKSAHAEALQKRASDLQHLQTTHAEETRDKLDQVKRAHQEEISALVEDHDLKYNSLHQELNTANEQLQQLRDFQDGTIQTHRCEELAEQVEVLKSEVANSQVELVQANTEVAKLMAELEVARRTLHDTTESDHLRYEMFELTQQHAAEISRIQDAVALENEKRGKERKQGAEVRDRLVSETAKLTNELSVAKSEAEKNLMDLHVSMAETHEAVKHNAANCQALELYKAGHLKALDELKLAQAEIERLKRARSQARKRSSSVTPQELEALQMAADAEREQNAKLREKIQEAHVAAERQATKLREVECALKVTTAELVEMQTVRPNGSEYSASPAPKSGLRSSRWAVTVAADQTDNERREEDENLGFAIEGNMAGMKEQIRQIENINKDMLKEEQRIMYKLSMVGEPAASSSESDSTFSARDIREGYENEEEL